MPSSYKRPNGQWRCVIRIRGAKPISKSFDTKKEADHWGAMTEPTIASRRIFGGNMNLAEVLGRYLREVDSQKEYATVRAGVLNDIAHVRGSVLPILIKRFPAVEVKDMNKEWWIKNIGNMKRLNEKDEAKNGRLSSASRMRYMAALRVPLKEAERWGVKMNWEQYEEALEYLKDKRLTTQSKKRDRRLQAGEYAALKSYFNRPPNLRRQRMPMADIMDLALLTALRESEIAGIKFSGRNEEGGLGPMLWVRNRKDPKEKMGNDWNIPLLSNWKHPEVGSPEQIIDRQKRLPGEDRIFPFSGFSISTAFGLACKALGIVDLHFHDLRHEGISRLFELGYGIPEVAKVSGHKRWTSLERYTKLMSSDLHQGPAASRTADQPTPPAAQATRPRLHIVK